jgi:hypothetical protein
MLIAVLYPEGGRGKTPRHVEFSGERLRHPAASGGQGVPAAR